MSISRETFERQCKRRFGTDNPTRMQVEYWEWMIRHGGGPYWVRQSFGLEPNDHSCGAAGVCQPADPDWCFDRLGATRTETPDGRIVRIGGEHEDWYDPDFCIYNDVVVLRPEAGMETVTEDSGTVEIYGYPEDVFPPTDFHSATLVGERIYIIGRLGYSGTRRAGVTPVHALDTRGYRVDTLAPIGPAPGWIYKHHASYDAARHAITVRGGKVHDPDEKKRNPDHLASHRLFLDGLRWEVINAHERWRRYVIECDQTPVEFVRLTADVFRLVTVPNEWLPPTDEGVAVYCLDVRGVRVIFMEFFSTIEMTVEGALPDEVVEALVAEVAGNVRRLGGEWEVTEVETFERR